MKLIDKWQKNFKEKEERYEQEAKQEEIEKAKNEHPEGQGWQGEGYVLKKKGEFSIDKVAVKDVLQLFAGQKVKVVIMHADAELE